MSRRNPRPHPRGATPAALVVVLVMTAACVPPPEDNDRLITYRPDTAMGRIQKRGTLVVGLESDTPPIAATAGAEPEGFAIDLARDIASSLGVEPTFVDAPPLELLKRTGGGEEPRIDIAFPVIPLTEVVVFSYAFSDPYYVGHQRLLLPPGAAPESPGVICLVDDPWATASRAHLASLGDVTEPRAPEECLEMLAAGSAGAATATDLVLLRLMGDLASYELGGDQLSTEGYGVVVRDDLPGLAQFVNGVLAEAETEGRWSEWYERWLQPRLGPSEPPELTAEDAAALFPVDLAPPLPTASPTGISS